ncbi:MAG: type II secretion system GspH family protein [Candidatus Omnitrophica bacterium]|nr:type II secretion system GspH family protein [Candidatus Omnitrophota bacterium]
MRMHITCRQRGKRSQAGAAFSLVEVMVSFGIIGMLLVTLFVAFSSGFATVELTREDQRATQILLEKMEVIRLYSWDQLNTPGFIPAQFEAPFYATNEALTGLVYTGQVSISNAPLTEGYGVDMKQINVSVDWNSSHRMHHREMSTFVSRYGLQNYIY